MADEELLLHILSHLQLSYTFSFKRISPGHYRVSFSKPRLDKPIPSVVVHSDITLTAEDGTSSNRYRLDVKFEGQHCVRSTVLHSSDGEQVENGEALSKWFRESWIDVVFQQKYAIAKERKQ